MQSLWRQVKHELSNARDNTLILAVIASFLAWTVTQLLKVAFG